MMHEFQDLFVSGVKEMYMAETQMGEILQAMRKMASHPDLKQAFGKHQEETSKQIERLERIASELNFNFQGADNHAIKGLLHDAGRNLEMSASRDVKDAALIASVQRIEHYEIASYGTLRAYAKHLKLHHFDDFLKASGEEEGAFDRQLTKIAEGTVFFSGINAHASKRKTA